MAVLTPDICVIGGGSGGLTTAAAAASFGVSVILIERAKMGGDCLNYGCVPSKSLIAAAKHMQAIRDARHFGIVDAGGSVDFAKVHDHIHAVIAAIAPHDSVERFEKLGVTMINAHARFLDRRTIAAGDHTIRARRVVIATGSRPAIPPIEGLDNVSYLTNESVFDLTRLPSRLAVIGGGPIGTELAQAFARLGSAVTVLERDTLLPREDPEFVAIVRASLERDGVAIREGVEVVEARSCGDGVLLRVRASDGRDDTLEASEVLVATGRAPTVDGLDLDKAGIVHGSRGITVDKGLRTTNRRVYAIGDCAGGAQFTHLASHHASLAIRSILFRLPVAVAEDRIPRVTFTQPALAQIGLVEAEARVRHGDSVRVLRAPLAANDRAQAERAGEGTVKLVVTRRGRLLGAGIVAPEAGEMLAPYALALGAGIGVRLLASVVLPYPTMAEAGRTAAIEFYKPKLTSPLLRRILALLRLLG